MESVLTEAGALPMGTPAYMSPEQARGEPADYRSDIFSLGVVLYEMASGHLPFKGKSSIETMNAVINQPHTPVTESNKEVPPQLSAIIDCALAKEPSNRYQSMQEMLDGLRQAAHWCCARAEAFDGVMMPYRLGRRRRAATGRLSVGIQRPILLATLSISIALTGLALLAFYLWHTSRPLAVAPLEPIRTIAVLPFKPLVAASRDESLELGMADTLITRLGSIRRIIVRPVSAVRRYSSPEQDAVAAGRELKVQSVLDGSIQQSGDQIRVTVRLLSVADGSTLWTGTFDEKFTGIFAVQDAISEKVAGALMVQLNSEERKRLSESYTENIEAYELYLNRNRNN